MTNTEPIETIQPRCFFCKPTGVCKAIETYYYKNQCAGYDNCTFYKTSEQANASLNAANARLRTLPMDVQNEISDKYHKGERPWVKEDNE